MIRSLRYVEPVSSFRSTYAYTNITHLIAGRVVAKAEGVSDWNVVLREKLLDPLGMKQSSYTAEAIKAAPNHAEGYRYAPDGSFEGQSLVSPENLAVTRAPKVAINDQTAYALGWILSQTPNGNLVWHNGGTYGFG